MDGQRGRQQWRPLLYFPGRLMKLNVYIDGFNLYYGSLKTTPYKWLDLAAFCRASFPDDLIGRIRYFTAPVRANPHNPGMNHRQTDW